MKTFYLFKKTSNSITVQNKICGYRLVIKQATELCRIRNGNKNSKQRKVAMETARKRYKKRGGQMKMDLVIKEKKSNKKRGALLAIMARNTQNRK